MTRCPTASNDAQVRLDSRSSLADNVATDELRRRLVRLAVKLVWNREDAEEIVQEAFKLALAKGPKPTEERFGPWLFRTVGNLGLNLRRRRKPEPLAPWLDIRHTAAPDARLQQVERLNRLRQAIDRLPDRQRTALVLRTMQRMDYAGIAEIMTLSVSAVRAHVHLARQRLAELLSDEAGKGGKGRESNRTAEVPS